MFNVRIIVKINRLEYLSIKRMLTNFPGRLPLNLQSTNYPGLSGLSSPNHGFDNNTGSNNQRENQQHQQHQQPSGGLLAAVTGRDANFPAIFISRRFGESGKLKPIPRQNVWFLLVCMV